MRRHPTTHTLLRMAAWCGSTVTAARGLRMRRMAKKKTAQVRHHSRCKEQNEKEQPCDFCWRLGVSQRTQTYPTPAPQPSLRLGVTPVRSTVSKSSRVSSGLVVCSRATLP